MATCETCRKSFDSQTALDQHTKDKHTGKKIEDEKTKKPRTKKAIMVSALIILLLGVTLILSSKPAYSPLPRTEHSKGNGTVEIIEFSDFQCPACGAAFPEVKSFIEKNPGKAKFVYRHFPLAQHVYAFKAAEASECAADQGKFWEYHDKLFGNQRNLLKTDFVRYAISVGLDMEKFNACLDSGVMASRVNSDVADANNKGVRVTPTFFIDGKKFEGVLTAGQFEKEAGG